MKAYAYARFSSDNQREESIDAQIRAITEYCDKNDIRIVRVFRDEAYSARSDRRPAFQEMFSLIKDYPVDFVIVHKLDRFARNRADAAFYRKKLKDAGCKLVSVCEPLDDSPESIIMEGLLESLNEYYSANLSRETKKGLNENLLKGLRCGAKPPRGYDCINKRIIKNKDAEKVKTVFQMYASGASFSEMEKATGWGRTGIAMMLKNENYIGTYVFGGRKFPNSHEAIIDRATWDKCQQRMHDRAMNARNRAKGEYMLSGLCFCSRCGERMRANSANLRYFYYRCNCQTVLKDVAEQAVVRVFSEFMHPTQETKDRFYELVLRRVNSRADTKAAKNANESLRKRIDKLMNALQYADEDQAEYILAQAKELKAQIVPEPKPVEVSREACDAYIDLLGNFKELPYRDQKDIIRSIVERIDIDGEKYVVSLQGMGKVLYTKGDGEA